MGWYELEDGMGGAGRWDGRSWKMGWEELEDGMG